jgi:tetratricopeptide (TPR) repeat protein
MPEPDPLPAIKTPWGSATPPSGASAGDVPPIPIPDHTLIRRIGKGSYGEVWLARNALGVYRAVKIIDRRAFDDDRPFEREFAGIQRFEPVSRSHESQLNILQVGRGPHCFYYVMELADDMGGAYASGGTSSASPQSSPQPQMGTRETRPSASAGDSLNPDTYTPRNLRSELLLRGRLPVDECVRLGLALTTALENLHRHGLVHRDIKPSNIVFVNGIPKLADIGLVAPAEATMSFVGTEGYLPPEGPGTVQADLFSLGKVLYEISTGHDRQQFPELPTGISELPDRAALAEFNEVLLRACAPDVKQRYESTPEMHADLALLQSGKSVTRMRAIERRLRFVQRAAAAITVIAALAAGLYFWQARQTKLVRGLAGENSRLLSLKEAARNQALAAEREALRERDRARRSEQDTHRVLQFLLRRVVAAARPQDEEEGLGRDITVLQALQAAEPAIPEAFAGQPQAEMELRQSLAATFRLLGLATNEVPHRQRALELSLRLLGPGGPEALTNRLDLALALDHAGLTNEYLTLVEQAWQTASNALGADDERTLDAMGYLGVAYRQLGRGADSVRLLEAGVQRCRAAFGDDDLRTLDMVNHLAWSYHLTGQNGRAVPLLEQTHHSRERVLGREHEETTRAMIDLGRAYQAVGREREAFELLQEAYEIRRRLGPQHETTLIAMDALALSCERAGRTNDALAWRTHALDIRETKLGPNNSSTVRTRNEVFRLRAALGAATNQPAR